MSSSFSGREAWFSFPKMKWNAEGRIKCAVHLPPAGSLGQPEMYSH